MRLLRVRAEKKNSENLGKGQGGNVKHSKRRVTLVGKVTKAKEEISTLGMGFNNANKNCLHL